MESVGGMGENPCKPIQAFLWRLEQGGSLEAYQGFYSFYCSFHTNQHELCENNLIFFVFFFFVCLLVWGLFFVFVFVTVFVSVFVTDFILFPKKQKLMSLLLGAELQENVTVVLFWIYYLFIPIFFLEIASLSGVLRQWQH